MTYEGLKGLWAEGPYCWVRGGLRLELALRVPGRKFQYDEGHARAKSPQLNWHQRSFAPDELQDLVVEDLSKGKVMASDPHELQ